MLVYGTIQVRRYEKDNERKWITEIIGENFQVLESRKKRLKVDDLQIEAKVAV